MRGPIIEEAGEVLARSFQTAEAGPEGWLYAANFPHASDPEMHVPQWLTGAVPQGTTERIQPSEVFPEIDEQEGNPDVGGPPQNC